MTAETVFTEIHNRGLIVLSGHDSLSFLQGLITNNTSLLNQQNSFYSCLLTPNGKFLFDFFVIKKDDDIILDCEGGDRAEQLLKRLQMFKLRADVIFELKNNLSIFTLSKKVSGQECYQDTRHKDMGFRCFEAPQDAREVSFEEWDEKRIGLGVPDGSRDMIPEKSTLLECNIDAFNGVDFQKGCYMGQELTARMHFRGLTKKTLSPVKFNQTPPPPFTDIKDDNGKVIAEMRSSCGNIGLALIRKELLKEPEKRPFTLLSS